MPEDVACRSVVFCGHDTALATQFQRSAALLRVQSNNKSLTCSCLVPTLWSLPGFVQPPGHIYHPSILGWASVWDETEQYRQAIRFRSAHLHILSLKELPGGTLPST